MYITNSSSKDELYRHGDLNFRSVYLQIGYLFENKSLNKR